jgi:hypothetical protein
VEFHESTDGELSDNIFQIEPSTWASLGMTGEAGSYPVTVQDQEAYELWLSRGWEPWLADYGPCGL